MQPGRARTSGLEVPLLPLARWVGWVAPVRPTHGVLVLSCPSAALRVCSVLGCLAPVHRCARAVCCVASAVSWATWLLFTVVLARCVVLLVRCPGHLGSRSPFFFFFLKKKKNKGARTLQAQARAAGAAVQQCCVLWRVSSVLWRRSRPRGAARASWCTRAWVRVGLVRCLFASGAGWLGGCVGCGCGLWLRCSLGGPG